MNILIISALDIWSMGEKKGAPSLYLTLKAYAERGHDVYFLTSSKSKESFIHKNIHIRCFSIPISAKLFKIRKIGFLLKSAYWLLFQVIAYGKGDKINQDKQIDIYYGYEIFGVPVVYRLAKKYGKPVVSRFQGTILKPWIGSRFWKLKWWCHIKAMKIPADLLIVTNDGTQGDAVLKTLEVNINKVKFWMNGVNKNIDLKDFDSEWFKNNLGISREKKILLCVNRLVKWKRIDRIINMMGKIVEGYKNIILLVVGDGSKRNQLEKMTKNLNLSEYVKFLGSVPHDHLGRYYSIADVFIQTNDLSNVSNPLLEAMTFGRCIVTVDNGDTCRFIRNNETGILIEEDNIQGIPGKILELLKNDELRTRLGKNARRFAEDNFWTWEERMNKEVATVRNLISKNSSRKLVADVMYGSDLSDPKPFR